MRTWIWSLQIPCNLCIDVETDDPRLKTQMAVPHSQLAPLTAINPDERYGIIDVLDNMALIERKIMRPFVDWSLRVRQKMAPQAHFEKHPLIIRCTP